MKKEKEKAETDRHKETNDFLKSMSAAEKLSEALILRPEWEVKPKVAEMVHEFTVSFNEATLNLTLSVNGEEYRTMGCKDILSGKIKFHQGINEINSKFNLWKYDEKN